jgi:hypothetical protein
MSRNQRHDLSSARCVRCPRSPRARTHAVVSRIALILASSLEVRRGGGIFPARVSIPVNGTRGIGVFGFSFEQHLRDRGNPTFKHKMLIELHSKTYVAVGLGFARSVSLPKLLLITADSEGWAEFVYQNNRRHGNNHLRSALDHDRGAVGDPLAFLLILKGLHPMILLAWFARSPNSVYSNRRRW